MTKLVAGERKDRQAFTELLHQLIHLRVITHSCTSEGCDIHD